MNRQELDGMWDHIRRKYGIFLRVLEAIPEDRFHSEVIPGMRTPAQLAVHTSGSIVRDIAEGVASGAIQADERGEAAVTAGLDTKDAVLEFARAAWARADAAIARVGDEELDGGVDNSWGLPLNGTFAMVILNDELTHHRGQLFVYARACDVEPPFLWGFADNEPEFRPSR